MSIKIIENMKFFKDNKKVSEILLKILNEFISIKKLIFYEMLKRMQFNIYVREDNNHLLNLAKKEIYVKNVENTKKFLFKTEYHINQEIYNFLKNEINKIFKKIPEFDLNFKNVYENEIYIKEKDYIKINLNKKIERVRIIIKFNNKIIILKSAELTINGLNFSKDEINDLGFFIQGTSVVIFSNFNLKGNIKILY